VKVKVVSESKTLSRRKVKVMTESESNHYHLSRCAVWSSVPARWKWTGCESLLPLRVLLVLPMLLTLELLPTWLS